MSNNSFSKRFNDLYNSSKGTDKDKFSLPGIKREVEVSPFTTGDQKKILKALEKKDIIKAEAEFDTVLRKCTNIDPLTLTTIDRHSLLVYLRMISIGKEYELTSNCPSCESKNNTKIDLSELQCTDIVGELDTKVVNINDKISLVLGITNRVDEISITNYIKQMAPVTHQKTQNTQKDNVLKGEDVYSSELRFATYATTIKKVIFNESEGSEPIEEIPSFKDKVDMVSSLNMNDSDIIADFIKNQKEFGYDMKVDVLCKSCSHEYDYNLELIHLYVH